MYHSQWQTRNLHEKSLTLGEICLSVALAGFTAVAQRISRYLCLWLEHTKNNPAVIVAYRAERDSPCKLSPKKTLDYWWFNDVLLWMKECWLFLFSFFCSSSHSTLSYFCLLYFFSHVIFCMLFSDSLSPLSHVSLFTLLSSGSRSQMWWNWVLL